MNIALQKALSGARRLTHYGKSDVSCPPQKYDHEGAEASELIRTRITSGEPLLAARIGTGELDAIITYLARKRSRQYPGQKSIEYVFNKEKPKFWYHAGIRKSLWNGAGVFSTSDEGLDTFSNIFISSLDEVDILGSWNNEENMLGNHLSNCAKIPLKDLEPYYNDNSPWSEALAGKKVLVVHPFSESIQLQYKNRLHLFANKKILPEFTLITYKPLQTIAYNRDERFQTWTDALCFMCNEIENLDFDIAIIGAGGYGLPIGAFIKKQGRQAIHLGGATQILFGIKGSRWEQIPFFQNLFNQHWIRPRQDETPENASKVEDGCYW
jgi:hypothetical protein